MQFGYTNGKMIDSNNAFLDTRPLAGSKVLGRGSFMRQTASLGMSSAELWLSEPGYIQGHGGVCSFSGRGSHGVVQATPSG